MSSQLFIEGSATGKDSKYQQIECRRNFSKLLERCGFAGRLPALKACGGRSVAYKLFAVAHAAAVAGDYVALLVDSEDPVDDIEQTWAHLAKRDNWKKPAGAEDEQVLLMTTCMETWIVSDRATLGAHYHPGFQESALPALQNLEDRHRHDIQDALAHACRNCKNSFKKGDRAFEVLGKLSPPVLRKFLPSFVRFERLLKKKL